MKTFREHIVEENVTGRYYDIVKSHKDHIHSKYGKNVRVQYGTSDVAGKYTSKIHEPSGHVHVSTTYDRNTYKVHDHIEESHQIAEEMTDEEIDAHNDSFNEKVAAAHDKYITKIYGKKAGVNWGAIHDEDGDHGEFTSKVYHPKKGKIYVTTHYNTKTHEVSHHSEE